MMSEEATAALRVFSFTKSAKDISSLLDKLPDESHDIGESFSPRNPDSRKYDRTTCIFESGLVMTTAITDHITAIVDFIESKKEAFKLLAADSQSDFDILCSYSSVSTQGYINLSGGLLRRLADSECDIAFDIYMGD